MGSSGPRITTSNVSGLAILFQWHPTELLDVAWLPGSDNFVAVVWNDPQGEEAGLQIYSLPPKSDSRFVSIRNAWDAAPSPDGSLIAVTRAFAGDVALVLPESEFKAIDLEDPQEQCGSGDLIAYLPNRDIVFTFLRSETWSGDGATIIYQWDPESGRCDGEYALIDGWLLDFSLSTRGDLLAIAFGPNPPNGPLTELWDTSTREVACATHGSAVEFNPSGDAVAVADIPTSSLSLIDAASCLPIISIAEPGDIAALAFSPDGAILAAATTKLHGGATSELKFWDTARGELLARIDLSGEEVEHLTFDSAGRFLLTARGSSWRSQGSAQVTLWGVPR